MAKHYFTDRWLRSLKPSPPGKRREIWDSNIPGFGVRVNDEKDRARAGKAGRITFVLYSRYPGGRSPERRTLGRWPELSLEKARHKAAEWRSMINKGIDPKDAEDEERLARLRAKGNTFASVAAKFVEFMKANKQRKADAVERGKRAQAHNLFAHIRRLFRWAIPLYIEHSPCAQLSPRRLIGERNRRDRVLTDAEIAALWKASVSLGYPYGPLYRLLLLTGVRLSEACEASWDEFDLQGRVWTIPATRMKKTGTEAKPHIVPLTDAMLQVLETLPRFPNGKFLFSNKYGLTPLKANRFERYKAKLDALMGNPQAWVNHDIRRTVRTRLSALRIPEEVREAVLAHARPGIKGHYDMHHYLDEKREALLLWAGKLRDIVEPSRVVVELRGRR